MIPSPGERFADWWANADYEETGYDDVFYHDVPPELAAAARRREWNESSKALQEQYDDLLAVVDALAGRLDAPQRRP